jgi:tetratricopeptide (TPR) repeat protein
MTKPEVSALYDRALKTAVAKPFERMEFAFQLARRLQVTGKVDEAVELFKKVPATAKEAGDARYFTLVGLHAKLSKMKPDDPNRGALLAEVQKLADEVNGLFSKQIASADAKTKSVLQMRVAQTRLLGADLALRDQKDAKRAVELLTDFEKTIAGLPGESDMMGEVLLLRVQAFYALGQIDQATEVVVKLAQQRPKEAGAIVFNLLTKMGEQQDDARAAGNETRVQELQANRAALTPFYVKWIENNPDPELKKQLYNARVFNAETQRQAAASEKNEAKRKDLLQGAMKQFEQLDSKESFQQFLELQPEAIRPKLKYDPLVKMGLARTQMALGQPAEARKHTTLLFHDKILGTGVKTEVTPGGEITQKDNPNYWEALIIHVRSNVALNQYVEEMKRWLAEQWVVYGDNAGGQLWKADFDKLCKELGVEKPAPATTAAPAAQGASEPAAAEKGL